MSNGLESEPIMDVELDRVETDLQDVEYTIGCACMHYEKHPVLYSIIFLTIIMILFVSLVVCIIVCVDESLLNDNDDNDYEEGEGEEVGENKTDPDDYSDEGALYDDKRAYLSDFEDYVLT